MRSVYMLHVCVLYNTLDRFYVRENFNFTISLPLIKTGKYAKLEPVAN